jgi:hypothetical protein
MRHAQLVNSMSDAQHDGADHQPRSTAPAT